MKLLFVKLQLIAVSLLDYKHSK